jgi:ammonium transporter, Amt family
MSDAALQLYAKCANANADSVEALLICLTDSMIELQEATRQLSTENRFHFRNLFIIICAAQSFFMQAGFAMICAGVVRRKNLQNTLLKNLLDAAGASIAFYAIGYAFAFGDGSNPNGLIGTTNFFLKDVDDIAFWLFQYAFSAASATIVAGTLAERCQLRAYFYYSLFLAGFVYPIVVHAIWSKHGFLSGKRENPLFGVGVLDTAGGGVVHITGGFTRCVGFLGIYTSSLRLSSL